jgi:hypothetical protein
MSKRCLLIAALACSIVLASCNTGGSGYDFVDQPLQGKIGGASWLYVSGTATDQFANGSLWIYNYDITPNGPDPFALIAYAAAVDKVLFVVPASVGLHELSQSGQTVTIIDNPGNDNIICVDGAVEILTIDPVGKLVTGRIDARFDSDNFVNGNFTAVYK